MKRPRMPRVQRGDVLLAAFLLGWTALLVLWFLVSNGAFTPAR